MLRHLASIFSVHVNRTGRRGPSSFAAATDGDFALVAVGRMVAELADGRTALNAHAGAQSKSSHHGVGKRVAEGCIGHMMTVSVERAYSKLVSQELERAGGEAKPRAEAGNTLAGI